MMEGRIAAFLAAKMPRASNIRVDDLERIHGGSSQETFKLRARWTEEGRAIDQRLILRRQPEAGLVVAEQDLEFSVYRALAGSGLPVPAAYFLELDSQWLDQPFLIMDLCDGKPGHFYKPGDPYDGHGDSIARQFWEHLGTLAAIDHRTVGLEKLRNGSASDAFSLRELAHWEALLDAAETFVEPIVRGAIRWLKRYPPSDPAKPCIVHGDYRPGNFLFTSDGKISAILDWEMCHIGDPLEDVAWAIDPFWPMTRHLPLDIGLSCWERTSGLQANPRDLDWWRLFTAVKACTIWTTAEASFTSGKNREMTVAMSGIRAGHFHRNLILTLMREKGRMG